MSEDRWYYHEKNRTDVEERELKDLLDECLAVFEGGECLEDFESSWAIFVIQDLVDTFKTRKTQIEQRKEGREFIESLKEIPLKGDEEE